MDVGVRVEILHGRYEGETAVCRSQYDVHKRVGHKETGQKTHGMGWTVKLERTQELLGCTVEQLKVIGAGEKLPDLPDDQEMPGPPKSKEESEGWEVVVTAGIVATKSMNILSKTVKTLPKGTKLRITQVYEEKNRAHIVEPLDAWCALKSPIGDPLIIKESDLVYSRDLNDLDLTQLKKVALKEAVDVSECITGQQYRAAIADSRRETKVETIRKRKAYEMDRADAIAEDHEEELAKMEKQKKKAIKEERFEDAKKLTKKMRMSTVRFAPQIEKAKSIISELDSKISKHGGDKPRKVKFGGLSDMVSSDATSVADSIFDEIMDEDRLEATLTGFPDDPRAWDLGTTRRWMLGLDPMHGLDKTASMLHNAEVTGDVLIALDKDKLKHNYNVSRVARRSLYPAIRALLKHIQSWDQRGLIVGDEWAEAELRKVFDKVDGGTGLLDKHSFEKALYMIGIDDWNPERIQANFNLIDNDGGGEVSYDEWVNALRTDDPDMQQIVDHLTVEIMVGHKVEARWRDPRPYDVQNFLGWYPAFVARVNDSKSFQLIYEDGSKWHDCPIERMRPVPIQGRATLQKRVIDRLAQKKGIETREEEDKIMPYVHKFFEKCSLKAVERLLSAGYEVKFDKEMNKIRRELVEEGVI